MRIIAGDFKGRRLYTPENYNIRPTTDKVKEAIGENGKKQMMEDLAVSKAAEFVVDAAKEK